LAEVLAALTIAAMVLVALIRIYSRAENSAAAVTRKLDGARLPSEIMQRIAEDLDRIIASGSDTRIVIDSTKFDQGYQKAQMTIVKSIYDSKNQEQTFEEIVWLAGYDYESDSGGLVLYRSHSGMAVEDKLLDKQRQSWEQNYPLVPICRGVTFFKIQVPRGENFLDKWSSTSLPPGITVTISFAEPFKTVRGTLDVPDEEKITRTIAIDRTRKIRFQLAPTQEQEQEAAKEEPEAVAEKVLGKEEEKTNEKR